MSQGFKSYYESNFFKSKPIYTLADCVTFGLRDAGVQEQEDEEYLPELLELITERFREAVYLCDEEQLKFLNTVAELSRERMAWGSEEPPFSILIFHSNGFFYLFEDDGKDYIVLPDELGKIYREVVSGADFAEINAKKQELAFYAKGLIELYGMYELEHFAVVWNQHHKDKISQEEAETFLSDLANFHSDYYFDDDYVAHDCLFEYDVHELWEETDDLEYYMPTKSVIRECVAKCQDADYKRPGQMEMEAFLAEHVYNHEENQVFLEVLQFYIVHSSERLEVSEEIRGTLEEAGAPLGDAAFVERFECLFNKLRENARIWELRGFTIHQYEAQTGNKVEQFRLPRADKKRKKKRKK